MNGFNMRRLLAAFTPHYAGRGPQDWLCTFSGVQYFPAAPRVEEVRIVDIAHHLSRLCRYTGAIRPEHYSVAEHSVWVSYLVPPEHAFAGLMHDSPEFVLNDENRPTKRHLPDYQRLEALNWAVIAQKFDLPLVLPACVHDADNAILGPERRALMPPMAPHLEACWPKSSIDTSRITILALSPNKAEDLFLQRYYELTRGLPAPCLTHPNQSVLLVRGPGMGTA